MVLYFGSVNPNPQQCMSYSIQVWQNEHVSMIYGEEMALVR